MQRTSGSLVPSVLNTSPFVSSITQPTEKSKSRYSVSDSVSDRSLLLEAAEREGARETPHQSASQTSSPQGEAIAALDFYKQQAKLKITNKRKAPEGMLSVCLGFCCHCSVWGIACGLQFLFPFSQRKENNKEGHSQAASDARDQCGMTFDRIGVEALFCGWSRFCGRIAPQTGQTLSTLSDGQGAFFRAGFVKFTEKTARMKKNLSKLPFLFPKTCKVRKKSIQYILGKSSIDAKKG